MKPYEPELTERRNIYIECQHDNEPHVCRILIELEGLKARPASSALIIVLSLPQCEISTHILWGSGLRFYKVLLKP